MKKIIFILSAFVLVACNSNNQNSNRSIMTETEYQATNPASTIKIPATFEPTLELTGEIKNTSLEELIRQRKGKPAKADQASVDFEYKKARINNSKDVDPLEQMDAIYFFVSIINNRYSEASIKETSSTSNLAKVFYLQDVCAFVRFNHDYYKNIREEQRKEQQEEREKNAQKNWDKYQ